MILYGVPMSTYVARVRIALTYKNIAFDERVPTGGYRSADYRKLVPMGSIPALVDGDFVLSESAAIVEYLEDIQPRPRLLPSTPVDRARARALSGIHDSWVEPRLRALYPLMGSDVQASADGDPCQKIIDDLLDRLQRFDNLIEPSPWAVGDAISIADCAWSTTLLQIKLVLEALGQDFSYSANIENWRLQLRNHSAFSPSLEACHRAMTDWIADKN